MSMSLSASLPLSLKYHSLTNIMSLFPSLFFSLFSLTFFLFFSHFLSRSLSLSLFFFSLSLSLSLSPTPHLNLVVESTIQNLRFRPQTLTKPNIPRRKPIFSSFVFPNPRIFLNRSISTFSLYMSLSASLPLSF